MVVIKSEIEIDKMLNEKKNTSSKYKKNLADRHCIK